MPSHGLNTARAEAGTLDKTSYAEDGRTGPSAGPDQIVPWTMDAPLDARTAALVTEHDDLDVAISVLLQAAQRDDLLITRLKKRKLQIKDEIAFAAAERAGRAVPLQEIFSCADRHFS